jgi:E3 ubiquitin-protein ligase MARCH6
MPEMPLLTHNLLVVHGYPGIFALAGLYHASVLLLGVLSTWSQSIRDKEFLVEMRLRNLEPEMKMANESGERRTNPKVNGSRQPG